MSDHKLEAEEKVLLEFLKWSGGPEDDPKEKRKSRIQAYVMSGILVTVSGVFFYFNRLSLYQVVGALAALLGFVFFFMATFITTASNHIQYTEKYIDTESVRERLREIKLNKSNQQDPSGWTR